MAVTTFLDLCVQLVEDAGISGEITSVSAQQGEFKRVVDWVVRATTEIEGMWFNWDFLHVFHTFATIVDVQDYPPPPDHNFWDVATAKIPADESRINYEMWTRKKLNMSLPSSGDVYEFTVLPSKALRLYSTPSSIQTIAIEYYKRPKILVDNLDTPNIPVQFRDIIVAKALQYYANYESADEVKAQALENLSARLRQLESHSLPAHQASGSVNTGVEIQVVAEGSHGDY